MKMPEPVAETTCDCYQDHIGSIYAGAFLPVGTKLYDKQALIDLLEAAAVEAEDADNIVDGKGYYQQGGDANATAGKIAAAIRSMKEKL